MSRSDRRPVKEWYVKCCVMCGRHYPTARVHAETCSAACRVAKSRGRPLRFYAVWRIAGRGYHPPFSDAWPGFYNVSIDVPGEVRSGVFVPRPLLALPQIADVPLDQGHDSLAPIIDTAADATADTPFIVFRPEPSPRGHISAQTAGDLVDDQAGDLVDDQAEDLRGGSSLALAAACELLGLTRPPENRAEYEKARKRVVNLVNATRRASEEKSRLLSCWRLIQRNSPYQPKFRGTSAAVVTDLSEERSVCNG